MPGLAGAILGEVKKVIDVLEKEAENKAVQLLIAKSVVKTPDEANSRDALPKEDLGKATEDWVFDLSSGTADAENDIVTLDLPDDKAIVIYGVKVIDPGPATFIFFRKGPAGDLKGYADLSKADPETGIIPLRELIGYEPNSKMKITAYITATGTVKVALLAKVAEPKTDSILKA